MNGDVKIGRLLCDHDIITKRQLNQALQLQVKGDKRSLGELLVEKGFCSLQDITEIILEHGKNPRNLGKTDDFNKDAKGHNPLCGDNVHVYLKLNGQKIVEDISFEGSGCAISMASASIMTDLIKGKNEHEAKEIVEDFLGMIKENPELKSDNLEDDEKTKLMCLSGVKQYPMRVKCATLSWHTLVSAFDDKKEEVKTEN